jgi:hypothetical protein
MDTTLRLLSETLGKVGNVTHRPGTAGLRERQRCCRLIRWSRWLPLVIYF